MVVSDHGHKVGSQHAEGTCVRAVPDEIDVQASEGVWRGCVHVASFMRCQLGLFIWHIQLMSKGCLLERGVGTLPVLVILLVHQQV